MDTMTKKWSRSYIHGLWYVAMVYQGCQRNILLYPKAYYHPLTDLWTVKIHQISKAPWSTSLLDQEIGGLNLTLIRNFSVFFVHRCPKAHISMRKHQNIGAIKNDEQHVLHIHLIWLVCDRKENWLIYHVPFSNAGHLKPPKKYLL